MSNPSTSRAEAFSDAVFAIAMTVLVLEIKLPPNTDDLLPALAERAASMAAFVVSFVAIGCYWLQHHRLFHMLARADGWLLLLNLIFLLTISILPFPTALIADRLLSGQQVDLAAAVYGVGQLLPALAISVLLQYVNAAKFWAPAADIPRARRMVLYTWFPWSSLRFRSA